MTSRIRKTEEDYLKWLMTEVEMTSDNRLFAKFLNDLTFKFILPMDKNYYDSGMELREEFGDFIGDKASSTSVLEVFVVISRELFELLDGFIPKISPGGIFRDLISNLKLDIYTEKQMLDRRYGRDMRYKFNFWMHHDGKELGLGDIFCLYPYESWKDSLKIAQNRVENEQKGLKTVDKNAVKNEKRKCSFDQLGQKRLEIRVKMYVYVQEKYLAAKKVGNRPKLKSIFGH